MQLVGPVTDILDFGDHVEEAEQRQETGQYQRNRTGHFTRQITTIDLHRANRAKESTAIRRKNSNGRRQSMKR